jgi:ferredoxin
MTYVLPNRKAFSDSITRIFLRKNYRELPAEEDDKDEDVCLHCGLCAERCPTGAWDMQKFFLEMTYAGPGCRNKPQKRAA